MEQNEKLYLVAVGKLMDRDYQFLNMEEVQEINKGLVYNDITEAFKDEECEKNAVIITSIPIKGKPVEILLAKKHKSLSHMELNTPVYIANVKNKADGSITRVLSDVETLPLLNNDQEEIVGTSMLEVPEGCTLYSVQILISYIIAKATIDIENNEVKLDDEIVTSINIGDTMYSLTQKLISIL